MRMPSCTPSCTPLSRIWVWGLLLAGLCLGGPAGAGPDAVRVAVVGGPVMTGIWPALAERASQRLGFAIQTVVAAPKEDVVPAFRTGKADLLIIHGSDESFALLARGEAAPLRAWALNEHVLVGPPDDPAQVASAPDGAEALRRIAAADAPLLAFRDPGSFTIVQNLWRRAGLRPGPRQQLYDDAERPQEVLKSAARQQAYAVVGHIPVALGKIPSAGLQVLLKGDPAMRRVFVVVEPGPLHPASRHARRQAHRLADFLVSPAGQSLLVEIDQARGGPWLFPLPRPERP